MGYRGLKRVLGESNLERKCRWLFGICLLGLVVLAFWGVSRIAENLAQRIMLSKGRERVRVVLFDLHWQSWTTDPKFLAYRDQISEELLPPESRLNPTAKNDPHAARFIELSHTRPKLGNLLTALQLQPENDYERQLLLDLKQEKDRQLADQANVKGNDAAVKGPVAPDIALAAVTDPREGFEPPYRTRAVPNENRYYYYEPIYWTTRSGACLKCHLLPSYGGPAADSPMLSESAMDFVAVRVSLPYEETKAAINWTRAVLIAVGILTVFFAMVALWVVVRYVVVKPLAHLREVSDDVARGQLDVRAEIHTQDEFEDLATSFNKMLRNLIETQAELRNVNKSLDSKVDELAQLNMRLHEMNRVKGEFLVAMSHELRTPLNSIIGFSEVLQGIDSLSDKQKRYVQNIQKSGRDLLNMINDILDLKKIEAGLMDVRLSEFPLDKIIHAQCDMVRMQAEDKNIDLSVEIDGVLPLMFQDQAKVQQILTNLLSNAIKFTPEGGRIVAGARGRDNGTVEMWVADTGVGIADADREIIFDKFRQGSSVLGQDGLKREYSGTGLGLSIVKELCKLLGGEVSVESELGKGSTFRVVLPWMKADVAQSATRVSSKVDEMTRPRRADLAPQA
ncbi:MAG TPA: ATP-binding protein [Pirellulaceae bacterium]|nr:ATP-binding protein [Pirellulaceae bacterium]